MRKPHTPAYHLFMIKQGAVHGGAIGGAHAFARVHADLLIVSTHETWKYASTQPI